MNDNGQGSVTDGQGTGMPYKNDRFQPKLRRNRKVELRWGGQYHDAVNKAVFLNYAPYMPSEPPQSIKEDIDKTGYVCKQCRDCFRFLSSIEDHTARRSWVLGYWCQQCFATICIHRPKGQGMCSACVGIVASKIDYLHTKGIKKTSKKGVTRVFYNQCQFFAHLRSHGVTTVDSNDVMLMPLPSGIQKEHYAQSDRVFKALMEVMFIKGIHIMDWLRDKKIVWNATLASQAPRANAIVDIVNRYAENCLPINRFEKSRQDNPIQFEDSRRKLAQSYSQGTSSQVRLALPESREENDESRTPNDIAFVDCGSTPNNCIAESAETSSPNKIRDVPALSELPNAIAAKDSSERQSVSRANSLWQSFSQQFEKNRDKSRDGMPKSAEDRTDFSSSTPINAAGPRVLTIRSPKNLSLSTIIKHLPSDGISRKNIVVVGDDCEGLQNKVVPSPETPASNRDPPVASVSNSMENTGPTLREAPKADETKSSVDPKSSSSSLVPVSETTKPLDSTNLLSQTFSEQMTLHGRIVFQNGRKYIIHHVPKSKYRTILPGSNFRGPPPLSVPVTVNQPVTVKKMNPLSRPIRILPKKPGHPTVSPPTQSRSRQSKVIKVLPKVARSSGSSQTTAKSNTTNNQYGGSRMTKNQKISMLRFRDQMLKQLLRVNKRELDAYIDHLKGINDEYSKAMGLKSDSVLTTNAKAIDCFKKWAASIPIGKSPKEERFNINYPDTFDKSTREWELRINDTDKQSSCVTCGKRVKPSTYIVGISGPAVDESIFCQCYNTVCYLCNANQGSMHQLKAHVKWHKGEKPFMCPDCTIAFPSSVDLEVHIWTTCFHPISRLIYGCGVCEIEGLLDMEAIAKHFLLLHSRRKTICTECKMEYNGNSPTYTDITRHFVTHHSDIESISDPKRLIVCNLKQCVIRPELFRAHLTDHIGILKWIYYKCPFCSMVTQGTGRNKTMIRDHLAERHLDRMHEVVSPESLPRILEGMKQGSTSSSTGIEEKSRPVSNTDISGPVIINARTITPASFEHGSGSSEEQLEYEKALLPKILEVRSEAVGEFENNEKPANDFTLQIIAVESMADNPLGSPAMDSEASDAISQESAYDELTPFSDDTCESVALEICTLPIKNDVDSLDRDEDFKTEITINPVSDIGDKKNLFETYETHEKSDISDNYQTTRLKSPIAKKRNRQKPWRIALNSPVSVEVAPVIYNCHLCGELINTCWSFIKDHFRSCHSRDYKVSIVSPKIPRLSTDYIEGGYREDSKVTKRKVEVPRTSPGPKRRRRWGPKKYFERPGSPSLGLCVRPEPVQEVEGSYRCKKCDEPFKDRAVLRDHIASNHRIKGQYLICLECGENFVVVPSLQMHLKALHGIQDPITYLSQNTAYAPDTLDDAEELEKATESNQCYVCMAVFEDKAAVDKHIRVHGMAFLKRKKFEAQKALKSSEKKGETPDSKDEPVDSVSSDKSSKIEARESITKDNPLGTVVTTEGS